MSKKTILQLIEEHEEIVRKTSGRNYKSLTDFQIRTLADIGFILREDPEIGSFIGTIDWLKRELSRERRAKKEKIEKNRRAREQEREEEFQPKLMKWILDNVRPGDYLKMKGCRDGSGYREVMEIDWDKKRMTCYKLVLDRWPNQRFIRVQLTEHGFDKILGTLRLVATEEVEASKTGYKGRVRYTSLRKIL
jgi:hypothetical protein